MSVPATGKVFAVLFLELTKWDHLSLSVLRFSDVRAPVRKVSDMLSVRKQIVPALDLASGKVGMVEKVTFGGDVCIGRERTNMTQFLALPGDVLVSKIRARQGSVGVVPPDSGPVSVTIHYRVLTPKPGVESEYAWLALRSAYARKQFLAATGGAAKGEISEDALLDIELPFHPPSTQSKILAFWHDALGGVDSAQAALVDPITLLNDRLLMEYRNQAPRDVIRSRVFVLHFKDLAAWDAKSGRAASFRLACPTFRPMGDFIEEATDLCRPADEPDKEWPVYGVNNKEGVFLNSHQKGATFNAPYKRICKDWFFHNPTRCNVGSLGVVPDVPADAITSPEYQVWRLKTDSPEPMLPGYVACLIQTPFFLDLVQFNRVGAVKQRMYTSKGRYRFFGMIDKCKRMTMGPRSGPDRTHGPDGEQRWNDILRVRGKKG